MSKASTSDFGRNLDIFKYSETLLNVQGDYVVFGPLEVHEQNSALYTDSFAGVQNASWRDQVRRGISATTVASGIKFDANRNRLYAQADFYDLNKPHNLTKTHVTGDVGFGDFPFARSDQSTIDSANNRAISKFLDALLDARSSFESGQDLGEYKETLHGLQKPLSSLQDLTLGYLAKLKKVKHRTKGTVNLRKALTSTYLEFTFGWNPLAKDVADAYSKLRKHRFDIVPISSKATVPYGGSSVFFHDFTLSGAAGLNFWFNATYVGHHSIRYKGAVRTGANPQGQVPLAQDLQLTPDRWLPTAWDLIPYSWIVDYFTNVGDIINAAAAMTSQITWLQRTDRIKWEQKTGPFGLMPNYSTPPDGFRADAYCSGGETTFTYIEFLRQPYNPVALAPSLEFRIPTLGSKPWRNIGALILDRVKPLKPFF
jgi:hypothetical protein